MHSIRTPKENEFTANLALSGVVDVVKIGKNFHVVGPKRSYKKPGMITRLSRMFKK